MIEPFDNYIRSGKVVKQKPSKELATSLRERAHRRHDKIISEGIDTANPDFTYEQMYEALREAIQSHMAIAGYKPYSHEATIAFVNEFFDLTDFEIQQLDEMRDTRNKMMYYGKTIELYQTESAFVFFKKMFPRIVKLQPRR